MHLLDSWFVPTVSKDNNDNNNNNNNKQHGDQKGRATDFVWSKNTYRLDRIVQEPGNRILYYLEGGPEKAFVREELMQVPETTEKPPYWVQGWK